MVQKSLYKSTALIIFKYIHEFFYIRKTFLILDTIYVLFRKKLIYQYIMFSGTNYII